MHYHNYFPSLSDFYYAYIKRPSTACIAPRCDAPAGLQHYSGFSHNEAGVPSVVSTSSCRPIVSPPPPPTFPNQSEPLVPGVRVQDPIQYTVYSSASKSCIRRFVITEKAPTRAFSWLKAATTAFTFKTLLRHYAKWTLTPRSLNVKLGPQGNYHKGRAAL